MRKCWYARACFPRKPRTTHCTRSGASACPPPCAPLAGYPRRRAPNSAATCTPPPPPAIVGTFARGTVDWVRHVHRRATAGRTFARVASDPRRVSGPGAGGPLEHAADGAAHLLREPRLRADPRLVGGAGP